MATMSVDLSLPPAKAQFLAKEAPNEEKFCIASMLFAAESGDMEELNMLLEFGMNPNVRDGYGRTPLHLAAWMGHVEDAWQRAQGFQIKLHLETGFQYQGAAMFWNVFCFCC
ncbi:Ankyrin repeat domain-containing protein 54 (Lyn-interacting ankyrin repeat protein) [Durusdinium trenchii]|uniref:Ankyrin repeat domain-containing protein 54 (Lyn-interacting ankyrin repeat protein) n=1 Tax=Durusdinium trenchii TaxID=1381693 RepID=A0ABP0I4R3_9DINO